MSILKPLKDQLSGASRYAQIALAAECADRVYTIYKEYWAGAFYESVKQSVDLAWTYAQGNPFDEEQLKSYLVELEDIVDFYYEEGITETAESVNTVFLLLQAISTNGEDSTTSVARALSSAKVAAQFAEAAVNKRMPEESKMTVAFLYEEKWQESALKIIDGWTDVANKEMFAPIREETQPWLRYWLDNSVR